MGKRSIYRKLKQQINNASRGYYNLKQEPFYTSLVSLTLLHVKLDIQGYGALDIDRFWTSNRLSDKKFISHIKYEKDKGVNFYVAKYLDKEIEYDYIWKN